MYQKPKITIIPLYRSYVWILPIGLKDLKKIVYHMLCFLAQRSYIIAKIELYLVNDAHIARSNFSCLACNGPTNILSFPSNDNTSPVILLSLDAYYREYQLFSQTPLDYLTFLLSHGLVHLAGFNHGKDMSQIQSCCIEYLRKNNVVGE